MKLGDLFYYSKQMNKKKKSDKLLIVFGFLFPLVVLMFVVLFLSLFDNIKNEINNNEKLLLADIHSYSEENEIIKKEIYNSDFELDYTCYFDNFNGIEINGESINKSKAKNVLKKISIAAVDKKNPFIDSYSFKSEYNEEILLAGNIFSNEPGEIIISSSFADSLTNSYDKLIGQKITLYANDMFDINRIYTFSNYQYNDISEYEKYNYKALDNFTIVGVFNSKLSDYYIMPSVYNYCLIKDTDIVSVDTRKAFDENGRIDFFSRIFDCDIFAEIDKANNSHKYIALSSNPCKLVLFNDVDNLCKYYNLYSKDMYFEFNSDTGTFVYFKPIFDVFYNITIALCIVVITLVLLNIIRIENYSLKKNIQFYSLTSKIGLEFKDIIFLNIINIIFDYIKAFVLSLIIIIPSFVLLANLFSDFYSRQVNGILDYNLEWYYYLNDIIIVFSTVLFFVVLASIATVFKYKNKLLEMRK